MNLLNILKPECRDRRCRICCSFNVLQVLSENLQFPYYTQWKDYAREVTLNERRIVDGSCSNGPVILCFWLPCPSQKMTDFTGDVATNLHNQHLGHLSNHMESISNTNKDSKDSISPHVIYRRMSGAVFRDFFTRQPSIAAKNDAQFQTWACTMNLHLVLASLKFCRTPRNQKTCCGKKYEAWRQCQGFECVIRMKHATWHVVAEPDLIFCFTFKEILWEKL